MVFVDRCVLFVCCFVLGAGRMCAFVCWLYVVVCCHFFVDVFVPCFTCDVRCVLSFDCCSLCGGCGLLLVRCYCLLFDVSWRSFRVTRVRFVVCLFIVICFVSRVLIVVRCRLFVARRLCCRLVVVRRCWFLVVGLVVVVCGVVVCCWRLRAVRY